MLRMCLVTTKMTEEQLNLWAYTINHFSVDEVYLIGGDWVRTVLNPFKWARALDDASGLPGELVLMQPRNGARIQATQPLHGFEHPEEATYLFGSDCTHFEEALLGGREPDAIVGVDLPGEPQMFGHVAAAVTFYDRLVKLG